MLLLLSAFCCLPVCRNIHGHSTRPLHSCTVGAEHFGWTGLDWTQQNLGSLGSLGLRAKEVLSSQLLALPFQAFL